MTVDCLSARRARLPVNPALNGAAGLKAGTEVCLSIHCLHVRRAKQSALIHHTCHEGPGTVGMPRHSGPSVDRPAAKVRDAPLLVRWAGRLRQVRLAPGRPTLAPHRHGHKRPARGGHTPTPADSVSMQRRHAMLGASAREARRPVEAADATVDAAQTDKDEHQRWGIVLLGTKMHEVLGTATAGRMQACTPFQHVSGTGLLGGPVRNRDRQTDRQTGTGLLGGPVRNPRRCSPRMPAAQSCQTDREIRAAGAAAAAKTVAVDCNLAAAAVEAMHHAGVRFHTVHRPRRPFQVPDLQIP
jgi:hypothetical protein